MSSVTRRVVLKSAQVANANPPQAVPTKTYICPINSAHRYTDEAAYVAHFDAMHTLVTVNASTPADAQVQTAPTGYQFVEFNVQALFAKAIGRQPPFIHVKSILGRFGFHKEPNSRFVANYALLLGGAGTDKGINPDFWFLYEGGPRSTSGIEYEDFDPGPVAVNATIINVMLTAYPRLEDTTPNTEDKIDSVAMTLRGFV